LAEQAVEQRKRDRGGLAGAGFSEQIFAGEQTGMASRWIGVGSSWLDAVTAVMMGAARLRESKCAGEQSSTATS
jgi:hypothetical protein